MIMMKNPHIVLQLRIVLERRIVHIGSQRTSQVWPLGDLDLQSTFLRSPLVYLFLQPVGPLCMCSPACTCTHCMSIILPSTTRIPIWKNHEDMEGFALLCEASSTVRLINAPADVRDVLESIFMEDRSLLNKDVKRSDMEVKADCKSKRKLEMTSNLGLFIKKMTEKGYFILCSTNASRTANCRVTIFLKSASTSNAESAKEWICLLGSNRNKMNAIRIGKCDSFDSSVAELTAALEKVITTSEMEYTNISHTWCFKNGIWSNSFVGSHSTDSVLCDIVQQALFQTMMNNGWQFEGFTQFDHKLPACYFSRDIGTIDYTH